MSVSTLDPAVAALAGVALGWAGQWLLQLRNDRKERRARWVAEKRRLYAELLASLRLVGDQAASNAASVDEGYGLVPNPRLADNDAEQEQIMGELELLAPASVMDTAVQLRAQHLYMSHITTTVLAQQVVDGDPHGSRALLESIEDENRLRGELRAAMRADLDVPVLDSTWYGARPSQLQRLRTRFRYWWRGR